MNKRILYLIFTFLCAFIFYSCTTLLVTTKLDKYDIDRDTYLDSLSSKGKLERGLQNRSVDVRYFAAEGLGKFGLSAESALPSLITITNDKYEPESVRFEKYIHLYRNY